MKQIKQKYDASNFGGFSDSRVRFFIFGFMTAGIVMATFLGIVTAIVFVLIFGIFTAVKINEFQEKNPESVLRHWQAMDRLYHGSVNAAYYQQKLKIYENHKSRRSESKQKEVVLHNNQRLILSHSV